MPWRDVKRSVHRPHVLRINKMKKKLLPMSKEAATALNKAHADADRFVADTIKSLKKLPPLARAPAVVNLRGILNEVEITVDWRRKK